MDSSIKNPEVNVKKSHFFISALIAMRNRHFFLIDVVFFLITPIFATAIRLESFDFLWQIQPQIAFVVFLFTSLKLATFLVGGLYNRMWQHASVDELGKIIVLGLIVLLGESVLFYELCRQNIMGLSRWFSNNSCYWRLEVQHPFVGTSVSTILWQNDWKACSYCWRR